MLIQLDLWQAIGAMMAGISAIAPVLWAVVKWTLSGFMNRWHERMDFLHNDIKTVTAKQNALEQSFAAHQLKVAEEYVRRDDHHKDLASVRASIDNLSIKIDRAFLGDKT